MQGREDTPSKPMHGTVSVKLLHSSISESTLRTYEFWQKAADDSKAILLSRLTSAIITQFLAENAARLSSLMHPTASDRRSDKADGGAMSLVQLRFQRAETCVQQAFGELHAALTLFAEEYDGDIQHRFLPDQVACCFFATKSKRALLKFSRRAHLQLVQNYCTALA